MKKQNCLTKKKEFDEVFTKGRSAHTLELGAKVIKTGNKETKLGILVGVKISKKAVVRNKCRRKIREAIRRNMVNIKSGYNIIIITRPGIEALSYQEISDKLLITLKKLSILNK